MTKARRTALTALRLRKNNELEVAKATLNDKIVTKLTKEIADIDKKLYLKAEA